MYPRGKFLIIFLFSIIIFCDSFYAADFNSISLAGKIADSIGKIDAKKYKTLAFSRIQGSYPTQDINELIDFTNVSIVKKKKYKVIDRSKLQKILTEQKYNLFELISPESYKELGNLLGVDMFLYGSFYNGELILKAIDVETSALIWSNVFRIKNDTPQDPIYENISGKIMNSIRQNYEGFRANKIRKISFWHLESTLNQQQLTDYLSMNLTNDGVLVVIDRENLRIILEEQKLNLENFVDQTQAKKMGELYGVDAFIYGTIRQKGSEQVVSLKMMNIYNGIIEWADLLSISNQHSNTPNPDTAVKKNDDMILIPGGIINIGSNTGERLSRPKHQVYIDTFYIDRYEVSNEKYGELIRRYKLPSPRHWRSKRFPPKGIENHPVVLINWHDAEKYCSINKKRLLREKEWEYAARGPSGNVYSWGNKKIKKNWVNIGGFNGRSSVQVNFTNKDISHFGVLHLTGNVREWIGTKLRIYPGNTWSSSKYNYERVIRGSSWAKSSLQAVGWYRNSSASTLGYIDVGFRCAKDPS